MKKIFSRKKLDLNKQTIVNLNDEEMKKIQGGSDPETRDHDNTSLPVPSCYPCPTSEVTRGVTSTIP